MQKTLSLIAAAAVVGAGFATAGAAQGAPAHTKPATTHSHSNPSYTPPPIDWGTCQSASLQEAGAVCGMLIVPLDYAKPKGTKIELAVSKVAHKTSDADAQGPMLVNPGGPGGSGLEYSRLGPAVPNGGGDPYDWIGFDPRGVGSSIPSLSCDTDYLAAGRPSYEPTSATTKYWLAKAQGYASDCEKAQPALLKHDHTTDWVEDMESIRKALGVSKINYYGFSYGTYLGQVYATEHPDRVRRFVFDGVVDPRQVWYEGNLAQEVQFDPNINTFFDWIAANDDSYGLGTDGKKVRAIYYKVLHDLTVDPDPNFGAADWNDDFVGAAYYVYDWDEIAHILVSAADGDLGPAKEWYGDPTGAGADATYATYMAVECTDAQWPSWKTQQRDAYKLAPSKPFLTWNNTWYNAPCLTWKAPASTPVKVDGKHAPGILLIEETNDAATPWSGAIETRKRFPKSALIEGVGGTTHAGSLSGVSCTDDTIATYLLTGKLPKRKPGYDVSDLKCDPVPPPTATPAVSTATAQLKSSGTSSGNRLGSLRTQLMEAQMAGR